MEMKNMPVCDLRAVKTVESASSIHLIENVSLVVFPQDAPPELKNALAAIPQKNVASTLWLHDTDRLQTENGFSHLNPGQLSKEYTTVCLVNGFAVAEAIPADYKVDLIINGMILLHENNKKESGLKINTINGLSAYADFDHCLTAGDTFQIDTEFLKYAKPKTAILAGDTIKIDKNVTSEMLAEKIAYLVAADTIICYQAASGFVRANSLCGDEIVVKEQ